MQCICCKCGTLDSSGNTTLCLPVAGSRNCYVTHCFCCAQPPRLKCIKCNMWRELDLMEEHGPCVNGSLHVFVYSEPWPPFPDQIPLSALRAVTVDSEQLQAELEAEEFQAELEAEQFQAELVVEVLEEADDLEDAIELLSDSDEVPEIKDVKPKIIKKPRWVTIQEIHQWTHCYRCGLDHSKKKGWLRHAQMCGQDPKYKTDMFFIHLHTKAWCGYLVRDVFWEKHTDPDKGHCSFCRNSRRRKEPLPYQPKAPPRKNEASLEKKRRIRILKSRKKRRETLCIERDSHNDLAVTRV